MLDVVLFFVVIAFIGIAIPTLMLFIVMHVLSAILELVNNGINNKRPINEGYVRKGGLGSNLTTVKPDIKPAPQGTKRN